MLKTAKKACPFEGLDEKQVQQSRKEHGENRLTRQKGKSFWRCYLSNLNDPVIRILIGALAVNLLLLFNGADVLETVGIAIAVFIATFISTCSEYRSDRAFLLLSEEGNKQHVRVQRKEGICRLPISELVVGDLVLLSAGERIPADGQLIDGTLYSDQSALTGESKEIEKQAKGSYAPKPSCTCALFRGCTVTGGTGKMLVTAVGDHSFLGEISREIQEEQRESPLKLRLGKLAKQISILGYVAAFLIAAIYLFNVFLLDSGMRQELVLLKLTNLRYVLTQLLHALTLGLTVIVVAVPEGLPMMIAVVLSSNIRKMVRDRVLVRKPVGIESAGSMNLLFTDKTGTLTEGKMKVQCVIQADGSLQRLGEWKKSRGSIAAYSRTAFFYGSEASIGKDESGKVVALGGSSTERALLSAVMGNDVPNGLSVSSRLPFDSARKYSAVSVTGKEHLTFVLGAPEKLLPHLTTALTDAGELLPFRHGGVEAQMAALTQKGGRVLLLALCEGMQAASFANGIHAPLTFLCAVCLSDGLRKEAAPSIAKLQDAGIQVVMITGDHPDTAAAIAKQCGLWSAQQSMVLTGEELATLSDSRIRELLPHIAAIARALPTDKSRLVRIAQEAGFVTGMTGDGINDAPALRRSDIGFAMGSGTQVAKDAGDIIILDNNLASIVRAVLYGRNIFKSIRKFISLQLTMNFCAVGITMICPFFGIDAPVTVVQMLWINLIMDTLGGIAFAGEAPMEEAMKEPPKKRNEPILNRYMVNEIVWNGSFTVLLFLFFLKCPTVTALFRPHPDRLYLMTAFFALFIFSSVFHCFNARTDRLKLFSGLGKNPLFLVIMLAILIIQIGFVYLGGTVLRTAPLTADELLSTMLFSLTVFPADCIRKALWKLRPHQRGY